MNSTDLKSLKTKCRCCLEDLNNETNPIRIDENSRLLFFELTNLQLENFDNFSSIICYECSDQFKKIESFRDNLIKTQNFLSGLAKKLIDQNEIKTEDESSQHELAIEAKQVRKNEDLVDTKVKKKKVQPRDEFPDFKCPICLKQFTEKRKIRLHIKRIHDRVRDFSCDECSYQAHTNFEISLHKKNVHDPNREVSRKAEMRICPDCGKSVRGNNALTMHIRKKHLNIKKYQCDHCCFASYGKYEIKSHLVHVHIPKEYKSNFPCSKCDSVLSSSMGLKVHMQHKHSGLKPYSCFCGKSYSLNETLKMHIRNVHYGERRFACKLCPKRYGQAVRLKDHMNNDHGTKQKIPCPQCDKVFPSNRNVQAHLVYHENPKFSCDQCSKKFYLSNKLKEHMKTHEGTEYACSECSRTFQLSSSLKRHFKRAHPL